MSGNVRCPECGKLVRIPSNYTKEKGRCPSCNAVLDLKILSRRVQSETKVPQKDLPARRKTVDYHSESHPLIQLTKKYGGNLKKYGIDLEVIYALIRKQVIHKKEFEEQKSQLRNKMLTPIIAEMIRLPDFSFSLQERIELWYVVFSFLPYAFPTEADQHPPDEGKDSEAVFNVYPRYEYAGLVSVAYVLSGYDNTEIKSEIIMKIITGERTTPEMKQLFQEILDSFYKGEFIKRTRKFLEETRQITKHVPEGEERTARQIEEDFNFGFSWIAFYLPS
ncbi:hypothetical protein AMJ80_06450 [bacterium SM23_31]|nr:MAG: hypothetical protein AMJ80_06450 [bacterium SM23_31]